MLRITDCRLRPMAETDRDRVLAWRNSDRVRLNMINDQPIAPEEHACWFHSALQRDDARFLILELNGCALAFSSLTQIQPAHGLANWNFYVGGAGAPKGTGSALGFLTLELAFEKMKLHKLCCEVFDFNTASVALQEKLGFVHEGRFREHYFQNGAWRDILCLACFSGEWAKGRQALRGRCFTEEV